MTETTSIPIPRWRLNYERVRAKMAALREKEEAKRAEQDAMRDMGNLFSEEEVEQDEPEKPVVAAKEPEKPVVAAKEPEKPVVAAKEPEKKPLKIRKREKRARKMAKLKARREEQQRPPKLNVLPAEQAALLRGADGDEWIDSQQTAEMLGMKSEPRGKKHGLIRRRVGFVWQYQLASVRMALAAKIDHVLQCEATAWQAEYLQAPVVFAVPEGWVEISEACKRAEVSMKTFIKRKEKNGWKFRHLRMRAEDGTLRRITCISEFMLANYIEARNRAVFGKSDWEYSLSRRAQARNNRRRGRA